MTSLPSHKLPITRVQRMKSKTGQAIIEFVLVFMIFLMMAGFAVELSNYFRARSMLTLAAYSAARGYAVNQNTGYAYKCATTYLDEIAVAGSIRCLPGNVPAFGAPFSMTVMMGYRPIVPWFNYFIAQKSAPKSSDNFFYMSTTVHMVAD